MARVEEIDSCSIRLEVSERMDCWIKDGMGVDKHARYFGRQNNMSNSHVRSEPNPPPPTQFCVWTWS